MSPTNVAAGPVPGDSSAFFGKGEANPIEEDGPLDEDYIQVKIYFYGPDKATRTHVFPQELYAV